MAASRALAIFFAAAILSACSRSSDTTTAPPALGTLSVQVLGLDSSTTEWGRVAVVKTDGGSLSETHDVPASGLLVLSVPVGTYSVIYVPPNAYNVTSVSPSSANNVKVSENATTALQFGVKLASGAIGMIADISKAPFPQDGGSASVVRTDVSNARDTTLTIPDEVTEGYYVVLAGLSPGTYRVSYRPPDGYDLLPGSGYTVNGGIGTLSIAVGPNTLDWFSFVVVAKSP